MSSIEMNDKFRDAFVAEGNQERALKLAAELELAERSQQSDMDFHSPLTLPLIALLNSRKCYKLRKSQKVSSSVCCNRKSKSL